MRCLSCPRRTVRIFIEGLTGISIPQPWLNTPLFGAPSFNHSRPFATTRVAELSRTNPNFRGIDWVPKSAPRWVKETVEAKRARRMRRRVEKNTDRKMKSSELLDSTSEAKLVERPRTNDHAEASQKDSVNIEVASKKAKASRQSSERKSKPEKRSPNAEFAQPKPKREQWKIQKEALEKKFGEDGWNPRKKLSPDAIEGIRAMHAQYPDQFTTPILAKQFEVSPEAIRRILKSKWRPTPEEAEKRMERWDRRGEGIWTRLAETGLRPPKKWRELGVGRATPGEAPKWSREYKKSREHPENIYTTAKKDVLATRPDAESGGQPAVPGESFADRIL